MGSSQLIYLALNMNNLSLHMSNYVDMNNYSTEMTLCCTQMDVDTIESVWVPEN